MSKLISMTDFVLEQNLPVLTSDGMMKAFNNCVNYANFLKQPLTLGMFVPCDEDGNVLEEPQMVERMLGFDEVEYDWDMDECNAYKKAKERVLFKGFEVVRSDKKYIYLKTSDNVEFTMHYGLYNFDGKGGFAITVEDYCNRNISLTESALKQFS